MVDILPRLIRFCRIKMYKNSRRAEAPLGAGARAQQAKADAKQSRTLFGCQSGMDIGPDLLEWRLASFLLRRGEQSFEGLFRRRGKRTLQRSANPRGHFCAVRRCRVRAAWTYLFQKDHFILFVLVFFFLLAST
jgi:hypothetical protein